MEGLHLINVVSVFETKCLISLEHVLQSTRRAERQHDHQFVVIRWKPKTTAIVFPSGKVIMVGSTSNGASRLAAQRCAHLLRRIGYSSARIFNWRVVHVVASFRPPFAVNPFEPTTLGSGAKVAGVSRKQVLIMGCTNIAECRLARQEAGPILNKHKWRG
jgi:hypothetical protein